MARTKRDALERQAGHTPPKREARRQYVSSSDSDEPPKDQVTQMTQRTVNQELSRFDRSKSEIGRPELQGNKTPKPQPRRTLPKKRLNKIGPTQVDRGSGQQKDQLTRRGALNPRRSPSPKMASPKAVSRVQGVKLWEGKGGNPFKYGWPHKQPSEQQVQRMAHLIAEENLEEQESRWQELRSKFCREGVPLAPHVKGQLLWIGADPEIMRSYAMDLLDQRWQSTPVYEPENEPPRRVAPAFPGHFEVGSTSQVRTGFQHLAVSSAGGELSPATRMRLRSKAGMEQAVRAGDIIRSKLERILADPNREDPEKWQKMIKAAASELEPSKGVSESELTELADLAQKWNPISGRCGADSGKQALIEQLAQMTSVMARTNLGKAAEFARALGNLCNGQPITTGLKRFEPRLSISRENEDSRPRGSQGGHRGSDRRGGAGPPRTANEHKYGGGSGRSELSQKQSSSASASKSGSIERNRPPGIHNPEGRLLTPEENPREKRARLNRPVQERLGPVNGENPQPMETSVPSPTNGARNSPAVPYNLRNRVASPGESNDTITTPST